MKYTAGVAFWRLCSRFSQEQPAWAGRVVYEVKPDELWDATKIARRVYGDPDEIIPILAAAGIDSIEHPIKQRTLILPSADQLAALKVRAGYSIEPSDRTAAEAANPILAR